MRRIFGRLKKRQLKWKRRTEETRRRERATALKWRNDSLAPRLNKKQVQKRPERPRPQRYPGPVVQPVYLGRKMRMMLVRGFQLL